MPETATKPRLVIIPSTYRGKNGFTLRGKDTRMFFESRVQAESVRRALLEDPRYEVTLADFGQPQKELELLPPAVAHAVDDAVEKAMQRGGIDASTDEGYAIARVAYAEELRKARKAVEAANLIAPVSMATDAGRYLSIALSAEHRTILGQTIARVAQAVVLTLGDEPCRLDWPTAPHRSHDGRLTCATVAGAQLAANQPLI